MWKQLQDVGIYALMTTLMMNRRFPLSLKEVLIGTSFFVIVTQFMLSAFPEVRPSWKKRLETTLVMIVLGTGLYLVPRL